MWSKVRDKVIGDGKPLVSGHIAYRAVLTREQVPKDLWSPDVILWAGPRTHLVHYPLRRGEIYNLVAVFHSKRYVEGWNAEGDAGHPMLQYLAQGACMATEDAVWLADRAGENPDDLPAAFRAYVQQRYLRTARVQIMARVYGDFYHARGPAAELRNQMLGPRTAEQAYEGISWLYGGM
jgi:salicylate hydroxylase